MILEGIRQLAVGLYHVVHSADSRRGSGRLSKETGKLKEYLSQEAAKGFKENRRRRKCSTYKPYEDDEV